MGHERVGYLPKSKRWRSLVAEMAAYAEEPEQVTRHAANTVSAVDTRFTQLGADPAVRLAFAELVRLAQAQQKGAGDEWQPIAFSQALDRKLPRSGSLDTRAIVHQAAVEAILRWQLDNQERSGDLFPEASKSPIKGLGSGAGFSDVARRFFSSLSLRYLNYFLEREASAAISNLAARERFRAQLQAHVEDVSRHAFETARITQSFAAGWFNKYTAGGRTPLPGELNRFLRYAFSKLREDFRRGSAE
jgi:hypothetical protein